MFAWCSLSSSESDSEEADVWASETVDFCFFAKMFCIFDFSADTLGFLTAGAAVFLVTGFAAGVTAFLTVGVAAFFTAGFLISAFLTSVFVGYSALTSATAVVVFTAGVGACSTFV